MQHFAAYYSKCWHCIENTFLILIWQNSIFRYLRATSMRLFSICTNPILIVSLGMITAIFHRPTFFYFCWFFYFFLVFPQVFVLYYTDKAFPCLNLFAKIYNPIHRFPFSFFFSPPENTSTLLMLQVAFSPLHRSGGTGTVDIPALYPVLCSVQKQADS